MGCRSHNQRFSLLYDHISLHISLFFSFVVAKMPYSQSVLCKVLIYACALCWLINPLSLSQRLPSVLPSGAEAALTRCFYGFSCWHSAFKLHHVAFSFLSLLYVIHLTTFQVAHSFYRMDLVLYNAEEYSTIYHSFYLYHLIIAITFVLYLCYCDML